MEQVFWRLVTAATVVVCCGALPAAACTHTTDRVVEPVGAADASTTTPDVADADVAPIGPIAPIEREPDEDYRLVRAPEFGLVQRTELVSPSAERQGGIGGINAGGASGFGGSDLRPVASGGGYF